MFGFKHLHVSGRCRQLYRVESQTLQEFKALAIVLNNPSDKGLVIQFQYSSIPSNPSQRSFVRLLKRHLLECQVAFRNSSLL
ncbi:MAG: hypothetical protein ACK58T_38800, partial [Phycisphaerae bacterium]